MSRLPETTSNPNIRVLVGEPRKRGRPRKNRGHPSQNHRLTRPKQQGNGFLAPNAISNSDGSDCQGKARTMPADDDLDRLEEIWDAFVARKSAHRNRSSSSSASPSKRLKQEQRSKYENDENHDCRSKVNVSLHRLPPDLDISVVRMVPLKELEQKDGSILSSKVGDDNGKEGSNEKSVPNNTEGVTIVTPQFTALRQSSSIPDHVLPSHVSDSSTLTSLKESYDTVTKYGMLYEQMTRLTNQLYKEPQQKSSQCKVHVTEGDAAQKEENRKIVPPSSPKSTSISSMSLSVSSLLKKSSSSITQRLLLNNSEQYNTLHRAFSKKQRSTSSITDEGKGIQKDSCQSKSDFVSSASPEVESKSWKECLVHPPITFEDALGTFSKNARYFLTFSFHTVFFTNRLSFFSFFYGQSCSEIK